MSITILFMIVQLPVGAWWNNGEIGKKLRETRPDTVIAMKIAYQILIYIKFTRFSAIQHMIICINKNFDVILWQLLGPHGLILDPFNYLRIQIHKI